MNKLDKAVRDLLDHRNNGIIINNFGVGLDLSNKDVKAFILKILRKDKIPLVVQSQLRKTEEDPEVY